MDGTRELNSSVLGGIHQKVEQRKETSISQPCNARNQISSIPKVFCPMKSVSTPTQLHLIAMIMRSETSTSCDMTLNINGGSKVYVLVLTAPHIVPDTYRVMQILWQSHAGAASSRQSVK